MAVNYFTEMCSGSEAGSYLRLIDFAYHSTLGLRVIKKKREGAIRATFSMKQRDYERRGAFNMNE